MAGRERKLTIVLTGEDRSAGKALANLGDQSGSVGAKIAHFGKIAALGFAAAAVGAVALGKGFVDAAIESEKATKQTAAVIKSMGGASKVTAVQVGKLSDKLSMMSGVDDELIQSGQNVLLTFGKVRNEVGKGNNVFDRATLSALNMSVALGTDLKAANIQLGKALNDPIKGITALSKAGVSFTEQQKEQIKAMVAVGDTLGAQKIILSEMEKQFGGSAEAQATAGARLSVVWGNLQEQLGARLLPIVEKVADWLARMLPGAMDAVGAAGAALQVGWQALVAAFQDGEVKSGGFIGAMERVGVAVRAVVDWWNATGQPAFAAVGEWLGDKLPVAADVIKVALDLLVAVIKTVGEKIVELAVFIKDNREVYIGLGTAITVSVIPAFYAWAAGAATAAVATISATAAAVIALAPLLLLVLAVGAITAAFVWASENIPLFRDNLIDVGATTQETIDKIKTLVGWVDKLVKAMGALNSRAPGFLGGGGSQSDAESFFGRPARRAGGGPVAAGMPYIVGEQRRELFVPDTAGRILPRVPMGGGGMSVVIHVNGGSDDAGTIARKVRDEFLRIQRRNVTVGLT